MRENVSDSCLFPPFGWLGLSTISNKAKCRAQLEDKNQTCSHETIHNGTLLFIDISLLCTALLVALLIVSNRISETESLVLNQLLLCQSLLS